MELKPDNIAYLQYNPLEVDREQISDLNIEDLVQDYHGSPIEQSVPSDPTQTYNPDRDFPGHSAPIKGSLGRVAMMGLGMNPHGLHDERFPEVIMESMNDVFDIMSRPIKAVAGAVDGAIEGSQNPLRSNADTTAKVVLSLMGMPKVMLKSSQGFLQGLMGKRGMAELFHRLGIKDIEERKTPEEVEMEKAHLEAKMASKGMLGKIITGMGWEIQNHPLEFWSSLVEDPTLVASVGVVEGAEQAFKQVAKFGLKAESFLKKGFSPEHFNMFKEMVDASRVKGGGGAAGLLTRIKQAPADFQEAWKRVWAQNNPQKVAVATTVAGASSVPMKNLIGKLREMLPVKSPQTSQRVQELLKANKPNEALQALLTESNSRTFLKLTKDPLEAAIGNTAVRTDNPVMARIGDTDKKAIWNALKRHNAQIDRNKFEFMRLEEVLKLLPEDVGLLGRGSIKAKRFINDPEVSRILAKPPEMISDQEFNHLVNQTGTLLLNNKTAMKFYRNLNVPTISMPKNPLMNPMEWGKMNMVLPVMESMGLGDLWKQVLWAKDAETEWLSHHFGEIAKAAKPLNKMGNRPVEWRMINKETAERLQKMLNQGGWEKAPVNTPELELLRTFRKQYDEIFRDLGLPQEQYRQNFVQHMKDLMEHELGDDKAWNAGGRTTDVKESIRESFKFKRQGEDWFIPDAFDSFSTYAKMVARAKFRNPIYTKIIGELDAMNLPAEVKGYVMELLNDYRGARVKSTIADTMAAGFMKTPLAKLLNISGTQARTQAMDAMDNLVQLGYLTGMGGNFKLALENLTQPFVAIPKVGMKAYLEGQKYSKMLLMEQWASGGKNLESLGPVVKAYAGEPEYEAMKRIVQSSEKYQASVGMAEKAAVDPHKHGKIFATPLESASKKAIGITGFPQSEVDDTSVLVISGIVDGMKRKGIKSFQALEKRPQDLRDILNHANDITLETMGHFNREARPLWARHDIGRFLYQYGSFGMLMANKAMKDMQHMPLFLKTLGSQAALATALTAGGLSGANYAAYLQAISPLKNLAALGSDDPSKAVKSPALKAGIGITQYGYGTISKALGGSGTQMQTRGMKNLKRSFSSAGYNNLMEAIRLHDPSRIILKKNWPKPKKK